MPASSVVLSSRSMTKQPVPDTPSGADTRPGRAHTPESDLYADELGPGAHVGNYEVESLRARGGFASVYRARHLTLGRTAALKVLHRELAGSLTMLQRFQQEAQAVNLIRHPNIVDVYEFGELHDGRPYFVMEWLDGVDLATTLEQRGAMPFAEVLAIMEDVGAALSAAHRHGIVHRDLKPSNVIAVPCGSWFTFKLVDFGIAKMLDDRAMQHGDLTVTGSQIGTPTHMAPEQILAKTIDQRSDVYAVGVLLYQLLSGRVPFDGSNSAEIIDKHLHVAVPKVSEAAAVPPSVDAVIAGCMQKDPADRFQTIDELLAALRRANQGSSSRATVATVSSIGVYFRAQLADDLDLDELSDAALDDMEQIADLAHSSFTQGGLLSVSESANSRLGVQILSPNPAEQAEQRVRILERALALSNQLDQRRGRTAQARYSIHIQVGPIVVRERAEQRDFLGGDLLMLDRWTATASRVTDGEIFAGPEVVEGLHDRFELVTAPHAPALSRVVGKRRRS